MYQIMAQIKIHFFNVVLWGTSFQVGIGREPIMEEEIPLVEQNKSIHIHHE